MKNLADESVKNAASKITGKALSGKKNVAVQVKTKATPASITNKIA